MKILAKAYWNNIDANESHVFTGSNEIKAASQAIDWLYSQTRYVWLIDKPTYGIIVYRNGCEIAHHRLYRYCESINGMDYSQVIFRVISARCNGYIGIDPKRAQGIREIYGPQIDPSKTV